MFILRKEDVAFFNILYSGEYILNHLFSKASKFKCDLLKLSFGALGAGRVRGQN